MLQQSVYVQWQLEELIISQTCNHIITFVWYCPPSPPCFFFFKLCMALLPLRHQNDQVSGFMQQRKSKEKDSAGQPFPSLSLLPPPPHPHFPSVSLSPPPLPPTSLSLFSTVTSPSLSSYLTFSFSNPPPPPPLSLSVCLSLFLCLSLCLSLSLSPPIHLLFLAKKKCKWPEANAGANTYALSQT